MTEELRILISYRLDQSGDALNAAAKLIDEELWRDAINRAYYAEFYAILALLALRGIGTSKHSGAIALFDKEFVKQGVFSKELSSALHNCFDMRQEADYAELCELGENDAREALEQASHFVSEVSTYLEGV